MNVHYRKPSIHVFRLTVLALMLFALAAFLLSGSHGPNTSIAVGPSSPSSVQQSAESTVSGDTLQFLMTSSNSGQEGWDSQTVFADQIPWDSVSSRYWETSPKSPTVSRVEINGREILSVSPGPEDTVDVIVQLRDEPVASFISSPERESSNDAEAEAQVIRDYREGVVSSHAAVVEAAEQEQLSFVPRQHFYHVYNGVAGSVKSKEIEELAQLPQVKHVYPDYRVHVTLEDSVPLIGAPNLWLLEDPLGRKVTGTGMVVAILDTGVDYTHPDLGGCFGISCRVIGGYDFINNDDDPMDDHGHGTHVAGIVGASGATTGVAPDVSFLAYKVLSASGSGSFSNVIAGIERATDPDGDPNTDDGADAINMSLGGSGNPDDPVSHAVDAAVGLGVVVAVSAGNSGSGYQTIGSPGLARKALTVGATTKLDVIAGFSSRGPVAGEWTIKPDILAPGVSIISAVTTGGRLGDLSRYRSLNGTDLPPIVVPQIMRH